MAQIAKVTWFRNFMVVNVPREFRFLPEEVRIERRGPSIVITPLNVPPDTPHVQPVPAAAAKRNAEITADILATHFQPPANDNWPLSRPMALAA